MGSLLYVLIPQMVMSYLLYSLDAPFQAASNAGVGAVMCSYNRIAGVYACEQNQTLHDLKNGMGFQVSFSLLSPFTIRLSICFPPSTFRFSIFGCNFPLFAFRRLIHLFIRAG